MPPVIFALAAAAGFFAAARGFAAALNAHAEALRREAETRDAQRKTTASAKDLGVLEWDESAGAYRPRPPQSV